MLEILQEFEFPKDIKSLTDAEKEQLHKDFLMHGKVDAEKYCETSPSKVLPPDSPEFQARKIKKKAPRVYQEGADPYSVHKFDPQKGYIVSEEDRHLINGLSEISPEDRESILKRRSRPATYNDVETARLSAMGPVEREVEERFGDI